MTARIIILAGLVTVLGLAACTSSDNEDRKGGGVPEGKFDKTDTSEPADKVDQIAATDAAGNLEVVRGHYLFGHEVRTLRPCGKDVTLWVVDRTNLLKDLHKELAPGTTPYAEIFVVATGRIGPPPGDGFGAEYPGMIEIEDVIYVANEGFGCDFDWSRFIYRAQGNEPFWTLEVLPTEIRLIRPGQPDLTWTDVKESRTGSAVIFHAIGADHSTVQLVIEAGPSRDTMSGAYYGLSARLILDGDTFIGHALRGARSEKH